MSEAFDPYHKWLAIPHAEQPANHYRLLGLALFEADADVIDSAADQRMTHVRSYQNGKHSAESQRILNELAAARLCLLDPGTKAAYDGTLRLRFDAARPIKAAVPVAVEILQPAADVAAPEPPLFVADRPVTAVRKGRGLSSGNLAWLMLAAVAVPAIAWIGSIIVKAKSERGRAAQDGQNVPVAIMPREPERPPVTNTRLLSDKPRGRYVRLELPRVGILSLTEVEVYSGTHNIARLGKASQISTFEGDNGKAENAIDGITHGNWPKGGLTHTKETRDAWWELDLGEERPLESIVVYNRIDACGERLEGFTLRVLDANRRTVVKRTGIPAPKTSIRFDVRTGSDGVANLLPVPEAAPPVGDKPTGKRFAVEIPDPERARWSIEGDELVQSGLDGEISLLFGDPAWQEFDISLEAKRTGGNDSCGIWFDYYDPRNNCLFDLTAFGNTSHNVFFTEVGRSETLASTPGSFQSDVWYRVRLQVTSTAGRCFINDQLVMEFLRPQMPPGKIGLRTYSSAYHFRNIVVKAPDGKVLLEGLPDLDVGARAKPNAGSEALTSRGGTLPTAADGRPLNFDFETGDLQDWTAEGDAFGQQPVNAEAVGDGDVHGKPSGRFFVSTKERSAGSLKGTLTSVPFKVTHPYASFLLAGGMWDGMGVNVIRRDDNRMIAVAAGNGSDVLQPVGIDLSEYLGQDIFIRVVDASDRPEGRVGFDNFRFHATKPDFSPGSEASAEIRAGEPVDVLALIDIGRDQRGGDWQWDEGKRLMAAGGWKMIRMPFAAPAEYDLLLELEGMPILEDFRAIVPVGGRQCMVGIHHYRKPYISGLEMVGGEGIAKNDTGHRGVVFADGRANALLCQVRQDAIKVTCNGDTIIDWHGDTSQLSMPWHTFAGWDGLLVGGNGVPFRINKFQLTPVSAPQNNTAANTPPASETNPSDAQRSLSETANAGKPAIKAGLTATEVGQSLKHHVGGVTRLAFHRALPLLVSTGRDGQVVLWNLDNQNAPTELHKFRWEVWTVKFSPDGALLAFANRQPGESEVLFKGIADGREVRAIKDFIETRRSSVASLAFSPDGRLFATGQDDGTIRLWELPSFTEFSPVSFGSNVVSLAFGRISVDKKRKRSDYVLAVGCWDGVVKTTDVTFIKDRTPTVSRSFAPTKVEFDAKDRVECVRFSPDGELLAVTRHGGHISLYDWRTGQSNREMPFRGGEVIWIGFHPQQPWCVTAHRNERMACIWNYETKELLCELKGHTGGVNCAEFSPDGRRVATAAEDHSIRLWELSGSGVPAAPDKRAIRKKPKLPSLIVGE